MFHCSNALVSDSINENTRKGKAYRTIFISRFIRIVLTILSAKQFKSNSCSANRLSRLSNMRMAVVIRGQLDGHHRGVMSYCRCGFRFFWITIRFPYSFISILDYYRHYYIISITYCQTDCLHVKIFYIILCAYMCSFQDTIYFTSIHIIYSNSNVILYPFNIQN